MNENAIHGAPKQGSELRIALSNHYAWLQLVGGGCMKENAIHGATKKGREWRIALINHNARLQTRG